jgi:hypothetical protein
MRDVNAIIRHCAQTVRYAAGISFTAAAVVNLLLKECSTCEGRATEGEMVVGTLL